MGKEGVPGAGILHGGDDPQPAPTARAGEDIEVGALGLGCTDNLLRVLGVPDFPYVVCPHPITNVGATDLEARARQLAPGVRRLLLGGRR